MKERRYFKLRRAKWRAGVLLVLKGWSRKLAVADKVFELRQGGSGLML